jgi:hypothetical protein
VIWQLPVAVLRGWRPTPPAGRDEFLTVYRAAGGTVPSDEYDLIVPLIRAWRILEPADRHSRRDLQQANLRAQTARSGPHWCELADPRYEP